MELINQENNLYITGIKDFHLGQTLECGQCFHFIKLSDNEYVISAKDRFLHIAQDQDKITMYDTTTEDFENIWRDYFDLDRDYGAIKAKLLEEDDTLREAIDTMWGVRILNQDFFETLISFIISQNKQIPHIKQIVAHISERCCHETGNSHNMHLFPDCDRIIAIGEEGLRECKTGFRAPYIADACRLYHEGVINEEALRNADYEQGMEMLMQIKGVGVKVANCVSLFGLGKRNAFPVDVWIKRIMENMYLGHEASNEEIQAYAKERFGEYGGYAQQYLFYYGKENEIGKKKQAKVSK